MLAKNWSNPYNTPPGTTNQCGQCRMTVQHDPDCPNKHDGRLIIADCTCDTPGPQHLSVTAVDGVAVVAVCLCINCGGILGTAGPG